MMKTYRSQSINYILRKRSLASAQQNESGVALIITLILLTVIAAIIPAAMNMTRDDFSRTSNYVDSRDLFYVAEAGLEHAKYLTEQSSLRTALAGPDDVVSATSGNTSDDDDNGTFGVGTPFTWNSILYDQVAFNGNTYYIRAYDNDDGDANFDIDNIIILQSVVVVDGTTTTVQAEVFNPPGIPISAVVTSGNLIVSGSPGITGTCGSVHANGDLDIPGSPNINMDATASGSYTAAGSPTIGGTSGGTQPNIDIPLLDPADFQTYADYTLASDGNVYDASGTFVGSAPWNGWNYSSPKWTQSDSSTIDASLYVEGDVVISSSPGTPGTPWEATIVATGFIEVSGNPIVANKKNASDPVDIQNMFLLAGTDLKYNGNPTVQIEGLIYAKEQLQISGNPDINGAIMAYNSPNVVGLVSQNDISGNATITYGCGLTVPTGSVDIDVISWKEL